MTPWRIGLLRGVNIGPHKKAPAADLRALMAEEGLHDGRTLINSGNLVFRDARSPTDLEALLESALARRMKLETVVMVRTGEEWAALVEGNPFAKMARDDPSHLVLHVLKGEPAPGAVEAIRAGITGPETVETGSRALYLTYPDGIGRSTLDPAIFKRATKTTGTARNWNTVLKIAALLAETP